MVGEELSPVLMVGEELSPVLMVGEELPPVLMVGEELSTVLMVGEELSQVLMVGEELPPVSMVGEELSQVLMVGEELPPIIISMLFSGQMRKKSPDRIIRVSAENFFGNLSAWACVLIAISLMRFPPSPAPAAGTDRSEHPAARQSG